LASNIAALSFCLREGSGGRKAGLYGAAYSAGRAAAYAVLGALIAWAGLSVPVLSDLLQRWMNKALGPLLILTGAVLLDLLPFDFGSWQPSEARAAKLLRGGVLGSSGMGFLMALAFCPVSAALFFGALIPLALRNGSFISLPFIYGLATGLPVFAFAVVLGGGSAALARRYEKVRSFERRSKAATAAVLVALGFYLTLKYVFHIL